MYAQSKDINEYWEEIGYEPSYEEKIHCIYENQDLPFCDAIAAYKKVMKEENAKDKNLENYISSREKFVSEFENSMDEEGVIFLCDSILTREAIEFVIDPVYAHTIEEINEFVIKYCDIYEIEEEIRFTVTKIYTQSDFKKMEVTYRLKDGAIDLMSTNSFIELESVFPYALVEIKSPFMPGDIVKDVMDNRVLVVGNDTVFVMTKSGVLEVGIDLYTDVSRFEYATEEELDEPLTVISEYFKGEIRLDELLNEYKRKSLSITYWNDRCTVFGASNMI